MWVNRKSLLCYNIFPKIPLLNANCEISLNSTFVRLLSKKGEKIWICKFFFKGRHSLKKFFYTTFFEMQMQGQKKESNRIYCKLMMRKLCIYYHSNNWKKKPATTWLQKICIQPKRNSLKDSLEVQFCILISKILINGYFLDWILDK